MLPKEKVWLLPEHGNLYKANLHCHSTVSDGKFTPQQIKEMYMQRGYHAVAFTDHVKCVPHPELTDENFVALTGVEIAFGLRVTKTSVHFCGISRDPMKALNIPNEPLDDLQKINAGIELLRRENCITTFNHPRWSGVSTETLAAIGNVDNFEVVNGYEAIQDGYGDSSSFFETELRRGRRVGPIGSDDSHTASAPGVPGYEYFHGFTVLKAPQLTYSGLIHALDTGAFYASTGPMIRQLWLENNILHVECSPASGIYVHGQEYCHRAAVISGSDCIESADIQLPDSFDRSSYLFVQVVDSQGKRAWSAPHWF